MPVDPLLSGSSVSLFSTFFISIIAESPPSIHATLSLRSRKQRKRNPKGRPK